MKKILCILTLTLTFSIANTKTIVKNIETVSSLNSSEILREVRENRKIEDTALPLTRIDREIREKRFIVLEVRENRKVRYLNAVTSKHLASLK